MIDLERLLSRVPAESADAMLGMARLRSASLAAHLRERMGSPAGAEGSVLSEPFLEGAFPWLLEDGGWDGLDPGLLHPRTLQVLRQVARPPYHHQVKAWTHLCREEPASVIVSSGTGSGKTECFLAPILDRLVRRSAGGTQPLEGVRAIMLYPLNALINSQEERLSTWFEPFEGKLRYALYNGETPEDEPEENDDAKPWRVDNRRALRESPPPVLVTNITMLEYMLIRQRDAEILRKSRDTLDFIVLDEAHSYVGAQAAEIALLLRRVALAFGRKPEELRYIATSATIGDGSEAPLREFLRSLSGAPEDQIFVVTGDRAPLPHRAPGPEPKIDLEALEAATDVDASALLAASTPLRETREHLRKDAVLGWRAWRGVCEAVLARTATDADAVDLLVRSAAAKDPNADPELASADGDSVLPVRLHLFHGTFSGLWACMDPTCSGRPDAASTSDWPFGAVYTEVRQRCRDCEGLVFEWAFCSQCGDGALKAEEYDEATRLAAWSESQGDDEFEQKLQQDETFGEEGEEGVAPSQEIKRPDPRRRYLLPRTVVPALRVRVDPRTGRYVEPAEAGLELLAVDDLTQCPCCGNAPPKPDAKRGVLRAFSAGAPFLMSQIAPGLLSHLSARADADPGAPMHGRQLITFTDARQGTARHSANIQIASERAFVRGFLYHLGQETQRGSPAALAEAERTIADLEPVATPGSTFERLLRQAQADHEQLLGAPTPRAWPEVVRRLAADATVKDHLRRIWRERDPRFDDPTELAEFLLYREIMRRPMRYTNAETLGLVRYVVPGWDGSAAGVPSAAQGLGFTLEDWRNLLRLLLTHFVRTNVALQFDHQGWMPWIDRRQTPIEVALRRPDSVGQKYVRFWPGASPVRPTRVVRLVAQALSLPLQDAQTRDRLNEVLLEAWSAMQPFVVGSTNGVRFHLDRFQLAPVAEAFACPVTRRIVDTCFRGLSPYDRRGVHFPAQPIRLPSLPFPFLRNAEGLPVDRESVERWTLEDPEIAELRRLGVWGDQQDRAAKLTEWIRAAEHSAQLPGYLLRRYEREFKHGQINVLGCSTTMEMGVDIGSIEAVMNTNTPPAIANYRQRIGRAGRQRQPISLGITLCKDRPLDRAAFTNPEEFLNKRVRAPKVSLDSPTIARRQANAYLLARFLASQGAELHRLTNGHFFGLIRDKDSPRASPVQTFLGWLDKAPGDPDILSDLGELLRGTPLLAGGAANAEMDLWSTARDQIETIDTELRAEWEALQATSSAPSSTDRRAAKNVRDFQRERLEKGYLLSELAGRGFLPSYGFPTDVVQFSTDTRQEREKRKQEDENPWSSRGYPSRPRDVAIFEYAPGRGIVVDGVVRESSGVTLNWKRPATETAVREVQNLRTVNACQRCGTLWSAPSAATRRACPECGAREPSSQRYLAPGGFAVAQDFRIHDDASDLGASLPVDPWVSARGGVWRALPDPTVGRLRASSSGLVFWFNPGPFGHGFGVCLHCGRAEAEKEAEGGVILSEHEPLRGWPRAAGGVCTGAPEISPFAVQRRLRLGHEIQTDVAELQLFDCATPEAALAIALALREAVARRIGIDADEMGFGAPPARLPFGVGQSWSAVIFDRASGGAGFSSTFAEDPIGLLRDARDLLDCMARGRCGDPEATVVCPRCVLGADNQHAADDTDRLAAFELLSDVVRRLALPEPHRVFGPESEYENAPLPDAISDRLQRHVDARVTVMLHGPPETWDLDAWPLTPVLDRWGARGRPISVALDGSALETSDPVTRRRVALWAQRARLTLLDVPKPAAPPALLAMVEQEGRATGWASTDDAAGDIGPTWGAVSSAPIVRGPVEAASPAAKIDLAELLRERSREAVCDLDAELDGPVSSFGARFRQMLHARNEDLARAFAEPCLELHYTDRYLYSPLAIRLVCELIRALSSAETVVEVTTLDARKYGDAKLGRRMDQDWRALGDRDLVFATLLGEIAPRSKLDTQPIVSHRRMLRFRTPSAAGVIYFDQGVGSWRTVGEVPFDFTVDVAAQTASIGKTFAVVNPAGTYFAVRLETAGAAVPA